MAEKTLREVVIGDVIDARGDKEPSEVIDKISLGSFDRPSHVELILADGTTIKGTGGAIVPIFAQAGQV